MVRKRIRIIGFCSERRKQAGEQWLGCQVEIDARPLGMEFHANIRSANLEVESARTWARVVVETNQPVGGEFEPGGNQGFGLEPMVVSPCGYRCVGDIDRVDGCERRQGGENPQDRDKDKAIGV